MSNHSNFIEEHTADISHWLNEERRDLMDVLMAQVKLYFKRSPNGCGLSEQEEIEFEDTVNSMLTDMVRPGDHYPQGDYYLESWKSRAQKIRAEKRSQQVIELITTPARAYAAYNAQLRFPTNPATFAQTEAL